MSEIAEVSEQLGLENPVIQNMVTYDHEQVVFCQDNATGLKAIIAIHNTTLGPALGGTRMWMYQNELEALNDVLRLSRGMSYKAAITGLNLGGGKAVIIGDSYTQKSEALFRRFGKFVDSLGGKYITAEDVGISPKDMEYVHMETDSVTGLPPSLGGSGDPSPVTAYGVYMGMKASMKELTGNESLNGKKVLVQGIGHVGEALVDYLVKEGAKVFISDIRDEKLQAIKKQHGAVEIANGNVYEIDMDVYAPCALGATLNDATIHQLKCSIVAGAANNQLANEKTHGKMLADKGILYAPDYLINAGGLINVNSEVEGYGRDRAMELTENIYNTTLNIYKYSKENNILTYQAANKIAEERIAAVGKIKQSY
jgi:leucine dehydrogenase